MTKETDAIVTELGNGPSTWPTCLHYRRGMSADLVPMARIFLERRADGGGLLVSLSRSFEVLK
ncbi:MAG: hypothetical protein CMN17_12690 [Roseovarius sp.]|nr:hypothetical protein [Roseovarius sp.]